MNLENFLSRGPQTSLVYCGMWNYTIICVSCLDKTIRVCSHQRAIWFWLPAEDCALNSGSFCHRFTAQIISISMQLIHAMAAIVVFDAVKNEHELSFIVGKILQCQERPAGFPLKSIEGENSRNRNGIGRGIRVHSTPIKLCVHIPLKRWYFCTNTDVTIK